VAGADPHTIAIGPPSDDIWYGVPDVGDVIDDKYRVEKRIGAGGMGAVVAVKHLRLGERYALKCLRARGLRDPKMTARFLLEARAAVRIRSEHIARVADVGQLPNGTPFILMEHLSGCDLASLLYRTGPLPITEAVDYVLQACEGVAEAHALGIVHRDLKPSNLFLTSRSDGAPLVKVLDFGIAKALDGGGPADDMMTDSAAPLGSPAYMSPEQIRNSKGVDFRTDVWGLGVILHELITGTRPFTAETPLGTLAAITADEPQDVRAVRPDVSPELDAVVRRCLEKSTSKRIQSVAELAEALAPFSTGKFVSLGRIKRLSRSSTAHDRTPSPVAVPSGRGPFTEEGETVTSVADASKLRLPRASRILLFLAIASGIVGGWVGTSYWLRRRPTEPLPGSAAASNDVPRVAPEDPRAAVASAPSKTVEPPSPSAPPDVSAVPARTMPKGVGRRASPPSERPAVTARPGAPPPPATTLDPFNTSH
jgi:serine/threonine-protein kinase